MARVASAAGMIAGLWLGSSAAWADPGAAANPAPTDARWAVQGQITLTTQDDASFRSPFQGPNSLPGRSEIRETFDATIFVGVRPWKGAEVWANAEVDQGFGLNNTLGLAGFPSGEAYKVGAAIPYLKLPRLFLRQTVDLGGETQKVDQDLNKLAGGQTANRLVLTIGKYSVVDIFDNNPYAHDPRGDFLNWALIDAGTFDYAANAWGYTYGATGELYLGRFAARAGLFDLTVIPNDVMLDPTFKQFQMVGEVEEDHQLAGQPGAVIVTAFLSRGRMGTFADAIQLAQATGQSADIAAVRRYRGRAGVDIDIWQQAAKNVGVFLRAGVDDGGVEPFNFADIDDTVSGGVSIRGARWGRADDTIGLAGVVNLISPVHQAFLNDGGLGILVGDGRLPHPGPEGILETYYQVALPLKVLLSFDYQFFENPAYNRDRGPVSVGGIRLHKQF
jgi:high affinity Mn2+ porin